MIAIADKSPHFFIPRLPAVVNSWFAITPHDISALVAGYLNLEQRESFYQIREGAIALTDPAKAPELSQSLFFHHKVTKEIEDRFASALTFNVSEANRFCGRGFPMGSLHPENLNALQVNTRLKQHSPSGFTEELNLRVKNLKMSQLYEYNLRKGNVLASSKSILSDYPFLTSSEYESSIVYCGKVRVDLSDVTASDEQNLGYYLVPSSNSLVINKVIKTFDMTDGKYYYDTNNAMNKGFTLHNKSGTYQYFIHDEKLYASTPYGDKTLTFSGAVVKDFAVLNDTLIVATSHYLYILDLAGDQIHQLDFIFDEIATTAGSDKLVGMKNEGNSKRKLTVLDLSQPYQAIDSLSPTTGILEKTKRTYQYESAKGNALKKTMLILLAVGTVMLVAGLIFGALSLVSPALLFPAVLMLAFSTGFIVPGLAFAGYVYLPRVYRVARTFFMSCSNSSAKL